MNFRPWNENVWFSPCYVISELSRTIQAKDREKIKKHKEAWVCAVAVICHSKLKPAEWWLQIPKKDPPDVLAMNLIPCKDGLAQDMSILQVEIFEISAYDQENIEKSIERKLGKKDYSGITLIGFARRKGIFNHENVANYIQELKPKALCIFLVVSEENNTNFSLIELFPECVKFKHDFGKFCKTTNQRDIIELTRGTKIKKINRVTNDASAIIP